MANLEQGVVLTIGIGILAGLLMPSKTAAVDVGAEVPWVSYQAENGVTTGQRLTSRSLGEIANEAVGRSCVRLAATGQHVEWKVTQPVNAIVVRVCLPDAPDGGGATHSLSLGVNGKTRQKLTVSSQYAWLYGKSDNNGNPMNNSPSAGPPHVYFDEFRALLDGPPLKIGDMLRVFKDAGDTAAWYVIDLVDLELVAPPAKQPAGFLSVTDFGAKPNDDKDDSPAFKACAAKAAATSQGVWIPAGTFHQTEPFTVDHIKVRGAGPWHTRLTADPKSPAKGWGGNVGIKMAGTDVEVSDLFILGTVTIRANDAQQGFQGRADRFRIENVWIEHTATGGWIMGTKGLVRRCRFRNTYADGLNVNNNSVDVVVEHNHSRGNGDDGFAAYASTDHQGANGPIKNITLRRNTTEAQWWGNGMAIAGGEGIVAEQNLIESANSCAGLAVSSGFKSWPGNGIRVTGNVISNCGGAAFKQPWGGIHLYVPGKDLKGLVVSNNTIRQPTNDGIRIVGVHPESILEAKLSGNRVVSPGANGLVVHGATLGSLELGAGNQVTGLAAKKSEFVNTAPAAKFRVTKVGR